MDAGVHRGDKSDEPTSRWPWRRVIGVAAVVAGGVSVVLGIALGFALQGVNETPSSPLNFLTNAAATSSAGLPLTIVVSVILSILAGTKRGRSRRLGVVAGLLALSSFGLFYLTILILPFRY